MLDLLHSDFTNRSGADLRRALGAAAADLAPLLPELAIKRVNVVAPELEPEPAKRRVFRAFRDVILRRAGTARRESWDSPDDAPSGPLLIAIEDLHWCDDLSLEFLLYFARQLSSQSVLLLLPYRSDEVLPVLSRFLADFDRERLAVEWKLRRLRTRP